MAVLNIQGFTQVYTRGSDYWQGSPAFRDFFVEWSKGKMGADFSYMFGNSVYTACSPSVGIYGQNRVGTSGADWSNAYVQMNVPSAIRTGKLYFGARVNRANVNMSQLPYPTLTIIRFSGNVSINSISTAYWPMALTTSTAVFVEIIADFNANTITSYMNGTVEQVLTLTSDDMKKLINVNFGSQYVVNPANTSQLCHSLSGGTTGSPASIYLKDLYLVWDGVDDPAPTGRLGAVTIARWLPTSVGAVDGDWTYVGSTGIVDTATSQDRKLFNTVTPGKFATSGSQAVSYTAPVSGIGTDPSNVGGDIYGIVVRSAASRNNSAIPVALKTQIDYGTKTGSIKQPLTAVNAIQEPLIMDTTPSDPVVQLNVTFTKELPE